MGKCGNLVNSGSWTFSFFSHVCISGISLTAIFLKQTSSIWNSNYSFFSKSLIHNNYRVLTKVKWLFVYLWIICVEPFVTKVTSFSSYFRYFHLISFIHSQRFLFSAKRHNLVISGIYQKRGVPDLLLKTRYLENSRQTGFQSRLGP